MASSYLLLTAPDSFKISSTLRYHALGLSKKSLTVTNNNHNFLLPAYSGGFKKISHVMGWPFKKAEFISDEFIFYLFDTIIFKINREFSLQDIGESVRISPFSISSTPPPPAPLPLHNQLSFVNRFPIFIFFC